MRRQALRCGHRLLHTRSVVLNKFELPSSYSVPEKVDGKLSLRECWRPWFRSLKPGRLAELQSELVELMTPEVSKDTHSSVRNNTVKIDSTNWINELTFEVINDSSKPTKEVVFIHGYGASLGCFARNFQLYKRFVGLECNYRIHFLDNITFGLSSNPRIESKAVNHLFIKRAAKVQLNDTDKSNDKSKLYKKYYKLIDSFEVNAEEFENFRREFAPILQDIENYYLSALEKWRIASGIKKIDFLIGHSYGGYWSASYAAKHPDALHNLILLSPVGVERQVQSIKNTNFEGKHGKVTSVPTLDPTSNSFLTRMPILSRKSISLWYNFFPFLPRMLKLLGPWGYRMYHNLWFPKLFKINRVIANLGGPRKVLTNHNDLVLGSSRECNTIIEYLYNSITNGSYSDIYIKYILNPTTTSKHPLYDKLTALYAESHSTAPKIHFLYGQYDFMNAEAGESLAKKINSLAGSSVATFDTVKQGGHNLYIDNPFDTNRRLFEIISHSKAF